jgi:hypothetical protein
LLLSLCAERFASILGRFARSAFDLLPNSAAQRPAHQPPPGETMNETEKDTFTNDTGNNGNLDQAVGCMRWLGGTTLEKISSICGATAALLIQRSFASELEDV